MKTRLVPALGGEGAATLYRAFVLDTLTACLAGNARHVELWIAGDVSDPFVASLPQSLPRVRQPEGDLGERMASALAALISSAGSGLVLGTDAPSLPPGLLAAADGALCDADVVLGPSADGGYYLVGARGSVPAIFDGVRYSSRHTLGDTLEAADQIGREVALIAPWFDVDTPDDLALLRTHLAIDPSRAPRTAALLCSPAASWTHHRRPG